LARFVKAKISLAPNNASAWNYLRGILDHNNVPYSRLHDFVRPYSLSAGEPNVDVLDLDNPLPSKGAQLPCPAAVEFLADIYEQEGGDNTLKAVEVGFVESHPSLLPHRICSFGNRLPMNMIQYERSMSHADE
jgi:hypothetical protein